MRCGDQAVGQGQVAGDVPIRTRLHRGRLDLVLNRELLGGLAVRPTGLEGCDVRLHDLRLAGEFLLEEFDRSFGRPVVEPEKQSEGEHVLGPLCLLLRYVELLERFHGHGRQSDRVEPVCLQRIVVQRALGVTDLLHVALGEFVGIHDEIGAAREIGDVGFERGGVHGHEHIRLITGGGDVVIGEGELETRNPRQGPGGGADLRGEVGQGQQIVAHPGCLGREAIPGQLHAVA